MNELSSMLSPWTPIISSAIALVAVVVGPLISLRVAKRQTATALEVAKIQIATTMAVAYRNIISPMRQKWIDGLRDRVSEFMSLAAWFYRKGVLTPIEEVEAMESSTEWNTQSVKLVLLRNQIELMLNPGEDNHNELLQLLETTRQCACEKNRHADFPKAAGEANARCKKILKEEWKRVKEESLNTNAG